MNYVEEIAWKLFQNTGEIGYYSLYKNLENDRLHENEQNSYYDKELKEEEMDL